MPGFRASAADVPAISQPAQGRKRARQGGQAIVELSLAAPVLVFLMLVAVDFGRVFYDYVAVVSASRVAAELAADPAKTDGDVIGAAVSEADGLLSITTADVVVSPAAPRGPGTLVTVTVTSTFAPITPLIRDIVGTSVQVQSTARSRSY